MEHIRLLKRATLRSHMGIGEWHIRGVKTVLPVFSLAEMQS